ncbi:MAG: phospho-N-acetylmuramoyl-pentapeptide-transferase [Oscillospiraceae bacterium]|nr:phospho-N-acetylmuramoyl-pentapeptide-transferase [Oscillospiraceae bacterium]
MNDVLFYSLFAAVAAFVIAAAVCPFFIPFLHRIKFGQNVRDDGPRTHLVKAGTPTMGGIIILFALMASSLFFLRGNQDGLVVLFVTLGFGFVGFLDDYIKVRKKRNEGLSVNQKLLLQVFIVAAYFTSRIMSGDTSTSINFSIFGTVDFWYFYYVIMGLGILYIVNAVNITDGVDGLCGSVTVVYCAAFMIICGLLYQSGLSVLAAATAGGCIGFLIWNFNPAKVFMGDTGSMFLGGIVCGLGIGAGAELVMVIAGAVYIWEALTVLIQTTYYKATGGKRLFRMTPIHHSFEMRGWKETKIVFVFSLIAAVFGTAATLLTVMEM